jgi:alkyl sulfatase BDS1-like metallo-beta-lactamase superfamily hydrolase
MEAKAPTAVITSANAEHMSSLPFNDSRDF